MLDEFAVYADPDCTIPFVKFVFDADGNAAAYLANMATTPTKKLQRKTNPGVDDISVTIEDANPGDDATGHKVGEFKLASTLAGLDTAVAGDPLSLGTTINAGVGAKASIHVRFTDLTGGGQPSNDLSLKIADVTEFAI